MGTDEFDFDNTFNAEEYLYFYSDILTDERLKREQDFLVKFTQLDQPLNILDLACGHGRHANALAKLGHKVTGIDLTEGFLKKAQEDASKLNVAVKYLQEDMRQINFQAAFDRIFVLFTAIGYFDDEQNAKVFQNIFNALKPDGIFCFDCHNRDTFISYYLPSSIVEKDGNYMIDQGSFDTLSGRCITKRTVIKDQSTKTFQYSVRVYNPTEILTLFKQIGFSQIEFYEDWQGNPITQKGKRMIVIAKK